VSLVKQRLDAVRVVLADAAVCSSTGVIMAARKVALGRVHKHQTVTVMVAETTLAIELDDEEVRVVRRTTTQPVRNIKRQRPRNAASVS
jgi:hypothetical protein